MTQPVASPFHLELVTWQDHASALAQVRRAVFIEEQGIAEHEEWDDKDALCLHVLARDAQGLPIGTARLFPSGRIGRMAVLAAWRGQGLGMALLQAALQRALALGAPDICLDAQLQAMPFYARAGFVAEGDVFMDAGIPHRRMVYPARHENASV